MIFIPAYNCEKQIPRVLAQIDDAVTQYVDEVVVVENRSTDGTLEAAVEGAKKLSGVKATVLQNEANYSLGGSIKRAFLYAIDNGYDYMITLHGDDQADIHDMLPVLRKKGEENLDLVVGARFHPQSELTGYSLVRRLGNRALNIAISLVVRRRVYDLIAGLNLFRVSFYANKDFLRYPNNLTFDAHVLLDSIDRNARIAYIPITWREEDQTSNARVVRQAWTILRLVLKYGVIRRRVFDVDKSGMPPGTTYESRVVYTNA